MEPSPSKRSRKSSKGSASLIPSSPLKKQKRPASPIVVAQPSPYSINEGLDFLVPQMSKKPSNKLVKQSKQPTNHRPSQRFKQEKMGMNEPQTKMQKKQHFHQIEESQHRLRQRQYYKHQEISIKKSNTFAQNQPQFSQQKLDMHRENLRNIQRQRERHIQSQIKPNSQDQRFYIIPLIQYKLINDQVARYENFIQDHGLRTAYIQYEAQQISIKDKEKVAQQQLKKQKEQMFQTVKSSRQSDFPKLPNLQRGKHHRNLINTQRLPYQSMPERQRCQIILFTRKDVQEYNQIQELHQGEQTVLQKNELKIEVNQEKIYQYNKEIQDAEEYEEYLKLFSQNQPK